MTRLKDNVEIVARFDQIHLSPHSTVDECFGLYEHLFHEAKAIDKDGWLNFPGRNRPGQVCFTWLTRVTALIKARLEATGTCYDRALVYGQSTGSAGEYDVWLVDSNSPNDDKFGTVRVLGEIRSGTGPRSNRPSTSSSRLAKLAREVFKKQPTRHFVLGFIFAGPLLRVYQFDRFGPASSSLFNVNDNPVQLIRMIVAFFKMDEAQLGYDTTIIQSDSEQPILKMSAAGYPDMKIQKFVSGSQSITGRGSMTYWLAHQTDFVGNTRHYLVKDSWQFTCHEEEGSIYQRAAAKDTINTAKYLFHQTTHFGHPDPYNIDRYLRCRAHPEDGPNRQHERIVFEYKDTRPLEMAGSSVALLRAVRDALVSHRSLYDNGIVHRNISIDSIRINSNPSPPDVPHGFLRHFDHAIETERIETERTDPGCILTQAPPRIAGDRIFMAVDRIRLIESYLDNILKFEFELKNTIDPQLQARLRANISTYRIRNNLVNKNLYVNDLESFFWVLIWVCCNYDVNGNWIGHPKLDNWAWQPQLKPFKSGILMDKLELDEILEEASERENTYKDLHPFILTIQGLFFSRRLVADIAKWENVAPDYKAAKLDGDSLYLRMLAIIDEELERLEAGV